MRRIALALVLGVVFAACDPIPYPTEQAVGHTTDRIGFTTEDKHWIPGEAEDAAFRTFCELAGFRTVDPLIAPGNPYFWHLHQFFGATGVDENTDVTDMRAATTGSTCNGGTLNKTAYWTPTIQTSGSPVEPRSLSVYYKRGQQGIDRMDIGWFPAGLRIVAGDAHATEPQNIRLVHFTCISKSTGDVISDDDGPIYGNTLEACPPGRRLMMSVVFPQCWDGVNLWLPGSAHMAYGLGAFYPPNGDPPVQLGCPEGFPVELPEITTNVLYDIEGSMDGWMLSSDAMHENAVPGQTGHSDWVNGWDPAIGAQIIDYCFRAAGTEADPTDCRADLIGATEALY